jgi:hypothetical protein
MRSRTSIITGTMAALMLVVICVSAASAIAPAQVAYSPTELWAPGHVLNYNLVFENNVPPTKDDKPVKYYHPTLTVSATVKYNITAVSGTAFNITETISGITVTYPFAINATHKPFVAVYDQTVTKVNFLRDFVNEVHGGPVMNSSFAVANHSVQNIPLNVTGSSPLTDIVNHVVYDTSDNSVVPQSGYPPQIINRFIVSSNISGYIKSFAPVVENAEGNTSTDKVYAHALFYTPMSFAGQHGTFWVNTALNFSLVSDMGLWSTYIPNPADNSTFPMAFQESDTYTWREGLEGEAFRWRAKFEVGYPKVGGKEQAKYDSQTGILLEYYTEQTRVDGYFGADFVQNIHPQHLKCTLTSVSGIAFAANATPEVPGFPIITLLVALGIGVALVYRKYRK